MKIFTMGAEVFAALCALWFVSVANSEELKLELVQVLFRHGARTPSPKEAEIIGITSASMYRPPAFHQLTTNGKTQAYTLGRALRARYSDFLSGGYRAEQLRALTSSHDRTKMSLQLLLAGLYPPGTRDERWSEELNWQPIPFSHTSGKCDILLEPYACPMFKELNEKALANSSENRELLSKYGDFLRRMADVTGAPFLEDVGYYVGWTYTALECHKMLNLSYPSWCSDEVYRNLTELDVLGFDHMSFTDELRRLNGGTMVRRMTENWRRNDATRLYLYSAHDLTLAAFVRAQRLNTFKIPPFSSAVVVEKLEDRQGREFVRFVSWDGAKFAPVTMENCDELCPMERYLETVKNVIPSDKDLESLNKQI